jgi:hypothetical protein
MVVSDPAADSIATIVPGTKILECPYFRTRTGTMVSRFVHYEVILNEGDRAKPVSLVVAD